MYIFDYQCFLDELRVHENPEKQEVVLRRDLWSQAMTIEEEPFFRNYLSQFKPIPYHTPEEMEGDFDFELLLILVAGSFSSDFYFEHNDSELPDLCITVSSGDQKVTKTLSELWSFQVLRLYEIFCEEQINLHSLLQNKEEAISIELERKIKFESYKKKIYNLKLEQIKLERSKILT